MSWDSLSALQFPDWQKPEPVEHSDDPIDHSAPIEGHDSSGFGTLNGKAPNAHKVMMDDFRAAQAAHATVRERATKGYDTEEREYHEHTPQPRLNEFMRGR